ncbi:Neurobeachin-like protein 1 [Lucilia cuprina]|nr:Neurobeachin-like protein 1 [Lucilia cuprina]
MVFPSRAAAVISTLAAANAGLAPAPLTYAAAPYAAAPFAASPYVAHPYAAAPYVGAPAAYSAPLVAKTFAAAPAFAAPGPVYAAAPAPYVAAPVAKTYAAAPLVAKTFAAPVVAAAPAPVLAKTVAAPLAAPVAPVAAVAAPVVAKAEVVDAHPQYKYAYDVQDTLTGDSKTQEETRDGDVVRGSYSLIEADGSRRVVNYYADSVNGFNAVVSKELPVAAAPVVAAPAPVVAKTFAAPILEPQLYPNKHDNASKLRDNATNHYDAKEISEFDSTIKNVVVRDFLANDENSQLEEDLRQTIEQQSQQDNTLEKLVISQECELITLMTKVKGRIEVNQTLFTFIDLSPPAEDGSKHDFRFSINKIREVHLRKFNLRRSALEIFLIDQTSYFLNFTTKTRNKIFSKILSLQPPNILYGSGRSPAELLKTSGLTQKWVNREISNFEYLMYLNTIAGRSYNDLSQYPVFPWILADYTSDILDLTDPKSFRDLSKPIGVINPKNEAEVRSKYDSFEDPSGGIPKFHYGTHYSNSAGVLHYLLRVEPFTSLHIELQSGRSIYRCGRSSISFYTTDMETFNGQSE